MKNPSAFLELAVTWPSFALRMDFIFIFDEVFKITVQSQRPIKNYYYKVLMAVSKCYPCSRLNC